MKTLERAIGEALLSDPKIAEALRALADVERRTLPNTAAQVARLALGDLGWLACTRRDGWVAGPRLEVYRRLDKDDAATVAGNVFPFRAGGRS